MNRFPEQNTKVQISLGPTFVTVSGEQEFAAKTKIPLEYSWSSTFKYKMKKSNERVLEKDK